MIGNNEYTCITLNVLTTINEYDILNKRKESDNDRDGRTAYNRRRSPHSQVHRVLHQSKMQKRRVESDEDRWTLEDQTRRSTRLHRQAVTNRRQKIKPAYWLATTKNLATFRSSALLWKVKANDPWYIRATFSIRTLIYKVKEPLYKEVDTQWMETECVHE